MRALGLSVVLVVAVVELTACRSASGRTSPPTVPVPADVAAQVKLEEVARGFSQAVALVVAPGDPARRRFVVEKTGKIRVLTVERKVSPTPFLDLSGRVSRGSEQGLLGLAFHPRFPADPRLYVNYTDRAGDTHVVEYRVAKGDPSRVDPKSEREVLFVDQPYENHNGGHLLFGHDGRLWIGLGDGGAANDPERRGQDRRSLLGKMLRLDVNVPKAKPEIVQIGLRNPWRYSFDRKTGDLYVGDVGQDKWEEIDVLPYGKQIGVNLGWNRMEGRHCFAPASGCDQRGLILPVVEYDHAVGCSITGGLVYRGKALPALAGVYFYADFCTNLLHSFRWQGGQVRDHWDWRSALDPSSKLSLISSFGEDADGEIYLVSFDGVIYKLVPATPTGAGGGSRNQSGSAPGAPAI